MPQELYFDNPDAKVALVAKGRCHKRNFAIVSIGFHPCAYVALRPDDPHDFRYMDLLDVVNGGITYGANKEEMYCDGLPPQPRYQGERMPAPNGVIGWDYGHGGDYYHYFGVSEAQLNKWNEGKKRWTCDEIYAEMKAMCKWLDEHKTASAQPDEDFFTTL